jgi:SAM-dependent methyltransferase
MDNAYRSPQKSQAYQDFLGSSQGQEFQAVLGEAFLKAVTNSMAKTENFSLLDAGCGDGWLAQKIFQHFPSAQISGFDLSQPLIDKAKRLAPQINFQTADLNLPFPFEPASFDIVLPQQYILHLRMHILPPIRPRNRHQHIRSSIRSKTRGNVNQRILPLSRKPKRFNFHFLL